MAPEPIFKDDQLDRSASFFETLFDFSFSKFVTETVVRILYIVAILLAGVGALGIIISGFANGIGSGVFALIFAPILFIFWVLLARVGMEIFVVIFRIADYLREIARNTKPE
jgi:hypothetical protein